MSAGNDAQVIDLQAEARRRGRGLTGQGTTVVLPCCDTTGSYVVPDDDGDGGVIVQRHGRFCWRASMVTLPPVMRGRFHRVVRAIDEGVREDGGAACHCPASPAGQPEHHELCPLLRSVALAVGTGELEGWA